MLGLNPKLNHRNEPCYLLQSYTVNMISTVTQITEQHLVLVRGILQYAQGHCFGYGRDQIKFMAIVTVMGVSNHQ